MERVTDPELLKQLEDATPGEVVDDPDLVRQLEGIAPPTAPQEKSRPIGGALGVVPLSENPDGSVSLGMPGMVQAAAEFLVGSWHAHQRGLAREAQRGQLGEDGKPIDIDAAQSQDALTASGLFFPGSGIPSPFRGAAASKIAPAIDETQAALRAAQRLQVDVPRGAVGDVLPRVSGALADAPIIGAPLANAAKLATGKLEKAATEIADELGGATRQGAGDTVRDQLINWTKVGSKDEAARIFEPVEAIVKDVKGPLSRTGVALKDLTAQAAESGLPPPAIVKQLEDALKIEGGLTWRAMQRLRSEIGDRLSGDIVPEPGLNKRALKAVYGALSEDLKFLVGEAGKARRIGKKTALDAWSSANMKFESEIAARRSAIEKIVGKDGSAAAETIADRLITMASDKQGADIARLRRVRTTLDDDAWNQLSSAALGRMGQSKDGFSIARWRTDYGKLSAAGKELMFNSIHRQALDDIAKVGAQFEKLERLGNPSGSARMGLAVGGAGWAAIEPISLLTSMAGGNALARILAKPATAKATADWSKAYAAAGASLTELSYGKLKRAALDLRTALDREGIEQLVVRPAILSITQQQETAQ